MGFTAVAQGLGQLGSDVGSGAELLRQQRAEAADQQLRQFQAKMQLQEMQQRIAEAKWKTPQGILEQAQTVLGRRLTDEERQRLIGVQPPIPKAKYTSTRVDEKGRLWGLNTETNMEELVPTAGGEFKGHVAAPSTGTTKVDPIIAAQIGKPPDSSKFPQGEDDPAYKVAAKKWGADAEMIKTRMASAIAEARGRAYGAYRPGAFISNEGEITSDYWGRAIAKGLTPYQPGFQSGTRQTQFNEMNYASGKLRGAIQALQPEDAWTTQQVLLLRYASMAGDEGSFNSVMSNLAAAGLNDRQQDYVVWLQQMGERVLSLRNVAGMGQGAQDLRAAIQATLPGVTSGSKQMALKRIDAVDNQINMLQQGIPKASYVPTPTKSAASPTGGTSGPAVGTVEGGYRFKGGDPSDQNNWVKVKP